MGVPLDQMEADLQGLEGLHFHTMCEQNADVLERTLDHLLPKFDPWIRQCKWINFGGGHHITKEDYDLDCLCRCIDRVQSAYSVQVYLEPGEAVALNAGYLVATVLDVVHNGMEIAILDASAACHMPDVLEMPYRPHILYSGKPSEKAYTYRLAGNTCLAGDVIGDYSFDHKLQPGEKLVFCDMAIYSMVKNNTFNGMPLPDILLYQEDGILELVRRFGYADFAGRLS
jgi:carboxynorspermidine decarboxylase